MWGNGAEGSAQRRDAKDERFDSFVLPERNHFGFQAISEWCSCKGLPCDYSFSLEMPVHEARR